MCRICIQNCNNILNATIPIDPGKLNIFLGANGTGKSTIAQVIVESAKQEPDYRRFLPYGQQGATTPAISGNTYKNIALFNGEYIKSYTYQKDTFLKDAFNVFVRTAEYDACKISIDNALSEIRNELSQNEEFVLLKNQLNSLLSCIKLTAGNIVARNSGGARSIMNGLGGYFNPPASLSEMQPFFTDAIVVGWADWRMQGQDQYGAAGVCPYCAHKDDDHSAAISQSFKENFDKASVAYAANVKKALDALADFIAPSKAGELLACFGVREKTDVLSTRLSKLAVEARAINDKLSLLGSFNATHVDRANIGNLSIQLENMKIDPGICDDYFTGEKMLEVIERINSHISNLLVKVNVLKGEIGRYKGFIETSVREHQEDINDLLKVAGFPYKFVIKIDEENSARALLEYVRPNGTTTEIAAPSDSLSWGERHAFALVMFMFDAIRKNADLIILDDPISSFDSNKKYALMRRLFMTRCRGRSLYQRTVLLLTHDLQPVIDYVQVGGRIMDASAVVAHYYCNEGGDVSVTTINKNTDIVPVILLMSRMAMDESLDLAVRIGCLRKFIEHTVDNLDANSPAYHILSSVIHGRIEPTKDAEELDKLTPDERTTGTAYIRGFISNFVYSLALDTCAPERLLGRYYSEPLTYSRLLILRTYCARDRGAKERLSLHHDVLRKCIDETFHVENDYIYMLDVRRLNVVPLHIKQLADVFVRQEQARQSTKSATYDDFNNH